MFIFLCITFVAHVIILNGQHHLSEMSYFFSLSLQTLSSTDLTKYDEVAIIQRNFSSALYSFR